MTLSSKKNSKAPPPSFLTKLSTLRDFVNGMGVKVSESQLSDTLKSSGYNVELALERILTGNFGASGGGGDVGGSGVPTSSSSFAAVGSSSASSAPASAKKRGSSSASSSSTSSRTPKSSSIKRHKSVSSTASSLSSSVRISSNDIKKKSSHDQNQSHPAISNRLLLCKRWTVACSKSTRGRVAYGESLDFTENWSKNNGNGKKSCTSITPKKSSGNNNINNKPIDPMVRFHSSSGYVEGTLNRYLCSILSPLTHLPTATNNNCNSEGEFVPLVSIEGEALMEDRSLVIGSEIPISLEIYINDPLAFFELFQQSRGDSGTAGEEESTSSKLFFRKNKKNGGDSKLPSYQGKKAKSSFTEEELAEAAYHLLQWAEKGEELSFTREKSNGNVVEKSGKEESEADSINGDGDGDYEDSNSVASEVDELNQLVASQEDCDKAKTTSLPELTDPMGFKSVTLRPYQRQALYWMCKREGCYVEGEMTKDDSANDVNGELDLLAELASSTNLNNNSDGSIQVWGGKVISCDCGPVVVSDEGVASKALPVVQCGQKQGENERKYVHHPLWKRRYLASDDMTTVFAFYVNELLGIASASPPNPPKQCVGGILADAMGLGKTVMLLSLILKTKEAGEAGAVTTGKEAVGVDVPKKPERTTKRKAATAPNDADVVDLSFGDNDDDQSESDQQMDDDESWTEGQNNNITTNKPKFKGRQSKGAGSTLVIAPLSLIAQWEEELASKTDLSHLVYYDTSKKATGAEVFSCVDVVVTTYGSVQSEYASLARSSKTNNGSIEPSHSHPLLKHDWKRVILDEAHGIKNTGTVVSKACCMLKAEYRWCVTGTPIQNSLQDVYGLLKFLRHEPWCEATFWKNAITNSLSGASNGTGNASAMADNNEDGKEEGPSPQALAVSAAFGRVKRVLAPIILRRTKDTLTEDGTPILTLPPIDSSVINVSLSDPEREFYNALLERSQSVFEGFLNNGTAAKSWFAIFSLLQRLRQACDHVSLTVKKTVESGEETKLKRSGGAARANYASNNDGGEDTIDDSFLHGLLNKFKKKSSSVSNSNGEPTSFATQVAESLTQCIRSSDEYMNAECPICLDEPRVEEAVHTPCAHMFHRDCLLDLFKQTGSSKKGNVEGGSCPVCNEWFETSRIIQIEKSGDGDVVSKYLSPEYEKENSPNSEVLQRDVAARETLESALNGANSSKLEAILDELDEIWRQDPGSKILIFSQYLGFLDIIGRAMDDVGVECFRIDGKMSLKERVSMIDKFNKNAPSKQVHDESCQRGSVFLVSMKAGGVGLNLVAASSVFITDHWWNQAIEDQCINRIHRIGQQAKVVRVRKFVVSDSVEEKIVNLQGKKKGMANEILNDTDGGGDLDSTKPTLEDFKLLFGR